MEIFTEKRHLVQQTIHSRFTLAPGIIDLSYNIEETLNDKIIRYAAFGLALDENTDVNDTVQLIVFIRGVMNSFEIVEEFLNMASKSLQQLLDTVY